MVRLVWSYCINYGAVSFLDTSLSAVEERLPTNNRLHARNPISAARTAKVIMGNLWREKARGTEGVHKRECSAPTFLCVTSAKHQKLGAKYFP